MAEPIDKEESTAKYVCKHISSFFMLLNFFPLDKVSEIGDILDITYGLWGPLGLIFNSIRNGIVVPKRNRHLMERYYHGTTEIMLKI